MTPSKQNKGNSIGNEHWLEQARALHRRALVVDTHVDTTRRLSDPNWNPGERHDNGHVDIPRLRLGGVDAVFFAVFAPPAEAPGENAANARTQLNLIHQMVNVHKDVLRLARTSEQIREAKRSGHVAVLIGVEGGHLIESSLDILGEFHERGATYMTLTHAQHTDWADSAGVYERLAPRHGGLTEFGRRVIREMNRLGMMVDVSHVSDETFRDVLRTSRAPVLASHSSCRAVTPHHRNLTDGMMRAIADGGGCAQITFGSMFVDRHFPAIPPGAMESWVRRGMPIETPRVSHRTPLARLVEHFEHALRVVGCEHVGIGSDFDGVQALPDGMEDCGKLPNLTAELLAHGHDESDLTRVLGENVLRVMGAVQKAAG